MFKPPNRFSDTKAVAASSTIEDTQPKNIPSLTKSQPEQDLERQINGASLFMQKNLTEELADEQKEAKDQNIKSTNLISHPLPNDVLFGRGRPLQAHHGNLRFHRIINKFRDKYKNAPKDEKTILAATVLAEVATADPPSLSTNDDSYEHKKTTERNDHNEIANNKECESATTCEASAPAQESSISSTSRNIDNDDKRKGGRFLKRTKSGNNWVDVSTAEAMDKTRHALRGQPRRFELRSFRLSSGCTSLAAASDAIGGTATMSSLFASPSYALCSGSRDKDVPTTAERQETSPSRPKKKRRTSQSQQQVISTTMATEASKAAAAAMQTRSTTSQGASSAIRNPLDALTGSLFPTSLQDILALSGYLIPDQTAVSSIQQQELQNQFEQYLSVQYRQLQQKEFQAGILQLRQDVQRQIVVEVMAQKLLQEEQEQLQAHQQQQLLTEQAIQRQLLIQQYQQQQQSTSLPTQHHHLTPQQVSQQLAPQIPFNSAIASFLGASIASSQQQQMPQHQILMLQQLLMGTASSDRPGSESW